MNVKTQKRITLPEVFIHPPPPFRFACVACLELTMIQELHNFVRSVDWKHKTTQGVSKEDLRRNI